MPDRFGLLTEEELVRLQDTHPEATSDECPTCRGEKGYVWRGVSYDCDCREQRRLNAIYSLAGIGLTYQRLDWDDLSPRWGEVSEPIDKYLASLDEYMARGIGLFLSGDIGTGKTLVANLILKELVRRGFDCYFTTFAQTIESFTSTWGDKEEKRSFAKRFMRSRVLCLDDLGKEFRNKLSSSTFDHILRTRVFEARPTILTTNLNAADLRGGYGASVLSLLLEKCVGVHLVGQDFRPEAHQRDQEEIDRGEMRPIV